MRLSDRILQRWRARKARRWIPRDARVLDIGCHQGEFLLSLGSHIKRGIGMDPLAEPMESERIQLLAESFREPLSFEDASFDSVVMLATLEHIRDKAPLARECYRLLSPAGRVIITVPAPIVDKVVDVLVWLRLADGMSLEEHHGFNPQETPAIFSQYGLALEHHSRFQLGCNHLYVFRKTGPGSTVGAI